VSSQIGLAPLILARGILVGFVFHVIPTDWSINCNTSVPIHLTLNLLKICFSVCDLHRLGHHLTFGDVAGFEVSRTEAGQIRSAGTW
jgi:hypothetical protein